ncbi:hypothetical protein [Cysteiniphilum sp. JM-1]|uniref:hypothetical protein n=1 Tax=Cysteiniphilum sp. JM-1 TaxID=2610891 RepID=UPI001244B742|nr:hypothetical protein [Cysteiniphilum sp. JM-1]
MESNKFNFISLAKQSNDILKKEAELNNKNVVLKDKKDNLSSSLYKVTNEEDELKNKALLYIKGDKYFDNLKISMEQSKYITLLAAAILLELGKIPSINFFNPELPKEDLEVYKNLIQSYFDNESHQVLADSNYDISGYYLPLSDKITFSLGKNFTTLKDQIITFENQQGIADIILQHIDELISNKTGIVNQYIEFLDNDLKKIYKEEHVNNLIIDLVDLLNLYKGKINILQQLANTGEARNESFRGQVRTFYLGITVSEYVNKIGDLSLNEDTNLSDLSNKIQENITSLNKAKLAKDDLDVQQKRKLDITNMKQYLSDTQGLKYLCKNVLSKGKYQNIKDFPEINSYINHIEDARRKLFKKLEEVSQCKRMIDDCHEEIKKTEEELGKIKQAKDEVTFNQLFAALITECAQVTGKSQKKALLTSYAEQLKGSKIEPSSAQIQGIIKLCFVHRNWYANTANLSKTGQKFRDLINNNEASNFRVKLREKLSQGKDNDKPFTTQDLVGDLARLNKNRYNQLKKSETLGIKSQKNKIGIITIIPQEI